MSKEYKHFILKYISRDEETVIFRHLSLPVELESISKEQRDEEKFYWYYIIRPGWSTQIMELREKSPDNVSEEYLSLIVLKYAAIKM